MKWAVDKFMDMLGNQFVPMPNGQGIQISCRPIQLWEVVVPKETMPNLLQTLEWKGAVRKDIQLPMGILRKALGAKKIPKYDLTTVKPLLSPGAHEFVGIYPIGIKYDDYWPVPKMEKL